MQQNRPTSATYTILPEKKEPLFGVRESKKQYHVTISEAFCLVINSQADCFSALSGTK